MFCLNDTMRYYLCPSKTDMRKGINSLIGVVHQQMGRDVRNSDVFIFIYWCPIKLLKGIKVSLNRSIYAVEIFIFKSQAPPIQKKVN